MIARAPVVEAVVQTPFDEDWIGGCRLDEKYLFVAGSPATNTPPGDHASEGMRK
jgi:hypothetical protein